MMGELPAFLLGVILLGVMPGFSAVGIQLFSCGFETDFCGMIQSTNHHFEWERQSGGTETMATGPSSAYKGTFYIYIEATEAPYGDVAEVETPSLQHSGTACVIFAYHMYGVGVGELDVRIKPDDIYNWRVSKDQGNHWRLGTTEVDLRPENRVAFRVVRSSDSRGDVALDDIVIRTGECRTTEPLPFSCSFEEGFCGMLQSNDDHFDWTRIDGPTDYTGPKKAADGTWFIDIETDGQKLNDVARIETPAIDFRGLICVRFKYHMSGHNVGVLNVHVVHAEMERRIFTVEGDQASGWQAAQINVTLIYSGDWLRFSGQRGLEIRDIGVDDILISQDWCNDCQVNNGGCDHICNGSGTCSCRQGYRLEGTHTCVDVNECTESTDECSDDCQNTVGSYRCTCLDGMSLSEDGFSCTATPDCSGSYGADCSRPCHCADQAPCDPVTGACPDGRCSPGWSGVACDETTPDCSGSYGADCSRPCHCADQAPCDPVTGACPDEGCSPGWSGVACDQGCQNGTFGVGCTNTCHCENEGLCDVTTGSCSPGDCADGWTGDDCSARDTVSETPLGTIITAAAVGAAVILIIIIIVVSVVMVRRRRKRKQTEPGGHIYVNNSSGIYDNDEHVSRDKVPYVDPEDGLLVAAAAPLVARGGQNPGQGEEMSQAHHTSKKPKSGSKIGKPQEAEVKPNVVSSQAQGEDPAAPVYGKVQKKKKTDVGAAKPSLHQTAPHSHKDIKDAAVPHASIGGDDTNQYYNLPQTTGCTVAMFLNHVKQLRKNEGFALQFKNLPANKLYEWQDAERNGLKLKNRFKNILPYDKTRVRLDVEGDDPLSDYVNASHIIGYDEADTFIASHGPIGATQRDFWRMVCQEKVSLIVMGTKLIEGGKTKCTQYWPDEGETMAFGDITVHLETETRSADLTTRQLRVARGSGEDRLVDHLQYTTWPDHGVPENAATFISFHRRVRQLMRPGAPTVVHCSAGVGRTGTFIAFDHLLQQAQRENTLDVVRCVTHLREQRINMVQTEKQYVFLHEALIEALLVRDTVVACENFNRYLSESKDVIGNHFKILEMMGPLYDKEDETTALSEENKAKNGNHGIIPRTPKRVVLTEHVDGRSDYINAVYVNSHSKTNAYIATQIPLKDTRIDFLQMAHQTRCNLIVAIGLNIHDLLEVEVDVSRAQDIGVYHVTVEPSSSLGDIEIHKVCIDKVNAAATYENLTMFKSREDETGATLSHSCHVAHIPMTSPADLDVAKVTTLRSALQDHRTGAAPAIFVCRDGATCCGLTIAALNLLEATTLTKMADIFHVVKVIKNSRPEFIPTVEQYRHLHHLIDELIGGDEGM